MGLYDAILAAFCGWVVFFIALRGKRAFKAPLRVAIVLVFTQVFQTPLSLEYGLHRQNLTTPVCCVYRVEPVALAMPLVDNAFQFCKVSGTSAEHFFFKRYLQNHIVIALSRCR